MFQSNSLLRKVGDEIRALVKELAPQSLNLIDALGMKGVPLHSPIAADWVKYNETDNRGELLYSKL
jgi:acyl-CoA oxidase